MPSANKKYSAPHLNAWTLAGVNETRAPFTSNVPAVWMRYQSKLWRVSLVPLKLNMNRFLRAAACCVNPAVASVFWSAYLIVRLQWQSLLLSFSYLPLLNYLRKICNQTATHKLSRWLCQAFDVWKQQQLLPQIPSSHWACQPLPHGKRSSLSIVHIYVLFKPLQSFAWSSLIYLVGKKSISVRNAGEIWDVRELWEQGRVAAETGIEIERGSKWGIGEGDEEKWSETVRGANERRCAAGEKRKWILYLSHCSRGERERREGENLSVFIRLSPFNVLVLRWTVFICGVLIISYCFSPWNSSSGTSIIQVTASDADDPTYGNSARLVYTLVQGQPHFSVDPQTGGVFLSSQELIFVKTNRFVFFLF